MNILSYNSQSPKNAELRKSMSPDPTWLVQINDIHKAIIGKSKKNVLTQQLLLPITNYYYLYSHINNIISEIYQQLLVIYQYKTVSKSDTFIFTLSTASDIISNLLQVKHCMIYNIGSSVYELSDGWPNNLKLRKIVNKNS